MKNSNFWNIVLIVCISHLRSHILFCRMLDSTLDMSVQYPRLIVVYKRNFRIYFLTNFLEVSIDHHNMVLLVEVKEESGKSFWKNRVESWKGKDKKNKKKKAAPKVENETSVPPEQKMEEAR